MIRVRFILVVSILFGICGSCVSFADTVRTKDNKEIKGIVIEDYRDRIIFSTIDGEVSLMKSDIAELSYDGEEDNLIKLAEQSVERGDNYRAFSYYDKAFKINPESKRAKDGLVQLQGYMYRKGEAQKEEAVMRQEELERTGGVFVSVPTQKNESEIAQEKISSELGLEIEIDKGFPRVVKVLRDSPASTAGIMAGDSIVAVWGKLTGYMSMDDLKSALIDKASREIRCTIDRPIDLPFIGSRNWFAKTRSMIGAELRFEFDGLTVVSVMEGLTADLRKDDIVVSIAGQPTRYMPFKKILTVIRNADSDAVSLVIRREVTFWRI